MRHLPRNPIGSRAIAALLLSAAPVSGFAATSGVAAEAASTTTAPPEIRAAATAATLAYRDAWRAKGARLASHQ